MRKIKFVIMITMCLLLLVSCGSNISENNTTTNNSENHQEPPIMITLTKPEFSQLRSVIKNGEEAAKNFMKSIDQYELSMTEINEFLKSYDSLPVPIISGSEEKVKISYFPESPTIYFLYVIDGENRWYRFEFPLNEKELQEVRDYIEKKTDGKIADHPIDKNGRIKLLYKEDMSESPELAKNYAEFWLDINGYLVKAVCMNKTVNVGSAEIKDILKEVYVSSLIPTS